MKKKKTKGQEHRAQMNALRDAEMAREPGPAALSPLSGAHYDLCKNWRNGRRGELVFAWRCLELPLQRPKTAQRLSVKAHNE